MLIKEPLTTKHLHLRNRLVLPPMATKSADTEGNLTPELYAYYQKRTEGGDIGLVITEHCFVAPRGRARMKQPSIGAGCDAGA